LNRDTELIARMAVAQPKQMAVQATRFIANGIAAFLISPTLTAWAVLLPVPLTMFISIYALKVTRAQDRKSGRVGDKAASSTIEVFKELSTVRQFGMEGEELHKFIETATWRNQLERRLKVTSMHTRYYMTQALQYGMLINTFMGVRLVYLGQITANRLLMCVINLQVLSFTSRTLTDQLPELMLVVEPLDRLATLLDSTPSIEPKPETYMLTGSDKPTEALGLRPETFSGHFKFEEVHFAYPTELQKRVLNGISFEVQPGQKVALVGSAGCGKSTCLQLVQRFYDPHQGHVLLDGHPLEKYDLHYLRAHIGVVAQDNVLFTASIYDNITYGMGHSGLPEATEEMVKAACDAANATEFIMEFPNRFATMVGDSGGIKLSGGQKQRIAIARAIIRSPPILLLDEATSALDSVNEKVVQKALDKMLKQHNGVALVIAHRLTTIKNCDNIIVIDKGKKVEEGTHGELMQATVEFEEPEPDAEGSESDGASKAKPKDKGKVVAGYFHHLWDTQMGEKTTGSVEVLRSASLEELDQGVVALQRAVDEARTELSQWETVAKAKAPETTQQTSMGPPSNTGS
jgi:ATP-binding cassette subfamily B (MDR/TAP) protein 1